MVYLVSRESKLILLKNVSRVYIQAMKYDYDKWVKTFVVQTYDGEGIKSTEEQSTLSSTSTS